MQRMRSIHSIRLGQAKAGGWDTSAARSKKKDRSVQTALNMMDNHKEYETFSYLYDKD